MTSFFDAQTELLTCDGWKFITDIKENILVATLGVDDLIEFKYFAKTIQKPYSGKMYRLKTRGVDIFVNSEASLYLSRSDYYNGRHSPPKKVSFPFKITLPSEYFGKNKRFQKSGRWVGVEVENFILPGYSYSNSYTNCLNYFVRRKYVKNDLVFKMDNWLTFLGWYIAEGCSSKSRGEVAISCNNTDGGAEKEAISSVINSLNLKYSLSMEDSAALLFKIYSKQLNNWLLENCGHLAFNKKVPDFIRELSPRQITIFLENLYKGDGHKAPTSNILTTTSQNLANSVMELLFKIGSAGRLWQKPPAISLKVVGKHDVYDVNWLSSSYYHHSASKGLAKNSKEAWIDFDGVLYSLDINKIIYIKRKGISYWCGV